MPGLQCRFGDSGWREAAKVRGAGKVGRQSIWARSPARRQAQCRSGDSEWREAAKWTGAGKVVGEAVIVYLFGNVHRVCEVLLPRRKTDDDTLSYHGRVRHSIGVKFA